MLARLWWKEYRVFGPVWLILVVAAALLQWLFLSANSLDSRNGALTIAALSWAVLYAFASGAASFAGERESKTLGFLDALPVSRWRLWLGKASFALVSTFGLALVLAGMAAVGTVNRDHLDNYSYGRIVRVFGTLMFEAAAWSLLWSSLSKNPLLAGVMGVLSLYVTAVVATQVISSPAIRAADYDVVGPEVVPVRYGLAFAALAVSALIMTWKPPGKTSPRSGRAVEAPAPIAIRTSSPGRSLIWQARREGWTTWLLVALVGLALPIVAGQSVYPFDRLLEVLLAALTSLVAGVSVFGTENASGSRRFLVHHGLRPVTVWWRKLLTWGIVLASILSLSMLIYWFFGISSPVPGPDPVQGIMLISLALANSFAVGLLCGMTITRRMTAALVGVIALVAVIPLQIGLVSNSMVPGWSAFLVPLIFVATSRAWAGDWLLEREGARPWLRLGAWLAIPSGMLTVAYVSYRAYGIPDVGPQYVGANLEGPAIAPDQNAAEAYRRAAALIIVDRKEPLHIEAVIESGWSQAVLDQEDNVVNRQPHAARVVVYWKNNLPAIEQARKASILPLGRFENVGRLTFDSEPDPSVQNIQTLATLIALDNRERLSRGDLPGAWDDILALFRMSNQLGTISPTLMQMTISARIHHRAVGLAFEWLGAPGQSPESFGRALSDLKGLPTLPNLAATMQIEASIIERTLDLSGDELADMLSRMHLLRNTSTLASLWFASLVSAPWERQRARRICRLIIARELPNITVDAYQRTVHPDLQSLRETELLNRSVSLTRFFLTNFEGAVVSLDRELVGRRALEQAVAIEAWKLGHNGQYPQTLDALVPGLLSRLPLDPFSGKPFHYVRSEGQEVRPPTTLPYFDESFHRRPTRPGQPLIYSIGPDREDDKGQTFTGNQWFLGDDVFAIP
jgi:ABC-2 family transporter protein